MQTIKLFSAGIILSTLFSLGCAKPKDILEQTCQGTACSEAEINAPIDPTEPIDEPTEQPNVPGNAPVSELPTGKYDHLDPNHIIPDRPLELALRYYEANLSRFTNKDWLTVIDMSQHSRAKRFYLVNMKTGAVEIHKVAHGTNSDRDADGWATSFSNTPESRQSSVGAYVTLKTYSGKNGYSMRLDGLESTNSNALKRAIVVHGSAYVNDNSTSTSGRSWGCPALDDAVSKAVINKIKGGSLLYIWFNK